MYDVVSIGNWTDVLKLLKLNKPKKQKKMWQ